MTELPANLVIRRVAPRRTLVLSGVAIVGGLLALGGAFEAGRYHAGYDVLSAARERSELRATVARLERDNAALHKQLSELDTMRVGLAQERSELAHSIGELQSQVASQAQQLAFYRGVVSNGLSRDDVAMGLKIQQLTITTADGDGSAGSAGEAPVAGDSAAGGAAAANAAAPAGPTGPAGPAARGAAQAGAAPASAAPAGVAPAGAASGASAAADSAAGRFDVHLTLLQTASPEAAVSGAFRLSVEGHSRGKSETLDLPALTSGKVTDQSFSFRYYQSLEQQIALPAGFSPERLTVEVRAGRKPVTPLIQTFPWKVEPP